MLDELVSIITPVYNSEKTLAETIESVLAQTYENWELILVDDGSKDASFKIMKEYEEKDSRIHCFSNEGNFGVAVTRTKAAAEARGQYVAYLDSDDTWVATKLARQIRTLQESDAVLCYSGCAVMNEESEATGVIRHVPLKGSYQDLLRRNFIPCLTVVIDRKRLAKEVEELVMMPIGHEDYALWLDILRTSGEAVGIDLPLANYRVNAHSLSGNKVKAFTWHWLVLRMQGIGYIKSLWYMGTYVVDALIKRA